MESKVSPNTLKEHIGYWLNRLRNEVHHSFEERLSHYDVTVAGWCILVALYDGEANSVNGLADYIEVDKATISRVTYKLIEQGLVDHQVGKDRRSGHLSLTPKAKNLVPLLIHQAEENEKKFFGHLTESQKSSLQEILCSTFAKIPEIKLEGWLIRNNKR